MRWLTLSHIVCAAERLIMQELEACKAAGLDAKWVSEERHQALSAFSACMRNDPSGSLVTCAATHGPATVPDSVCSAIVLRPAG